ncbi:Zinc dependent phospholipase C [Sporomusa ovata DSM 2662]|uniref:Broad-substrate range phospholipase C n=1 Tax=Sporomusa ovata TaxID=2378 RepID=A0A0U1L3Y2_9FIRM|nr:zinc dependent phospholipase C [Sporomusa ovata]EQB25055.1 zinc dependent phospholipase C [Sporomusa ovata DSM 2662]CQR73604.1 Broad-substrate range phospholipase C [Sporomusa ovata]
MINTLKAAPTDACLHFMLAVASPFQGFLDKPGLTHEFCNHQALSIIKNDGLWHSTHAIENFELYYHLSLCSAKKYDLKKAAFFLGASAHILQDLCVPHHARAKLFNGHKQYEGWAQANYDKYAVLTEGLYGQGLESLINNNACVAAEFFDWVRCEDDVVHYNKATEVLLPLAQRTTAGLFHAFTTEIHNFWQFS